ncbi:hypothetical protein GO613_02380 [Azoarcus communis]|uniref:hypothetical protein n=1 Tax=Parazoarcus communis TaxID=41977 RepID=UPI00145980A3|nr:hypothetical protein [Parazoarcus communis]NMG46950.1 hypothetical protein [Parazoarcus communis]
MRFLRSVLFFAFGFALSGLAVSAFAQSLESMLGPAPKVINATGVSGALQALLDRPMTYTDQGVKRSTDSVFRLGGVDLPLHASREVPKSAVVSAGRFAARALGPVAIAATAYEAYGLFYQNDEWVVPEARGAGGSSFSGWNWRHHQATGSCRTSSSTCSYEQAAQEACSVAPGSNGSVWHGNYNSSAYTCRRTDTTTWTTAASKTTVYVPSYVPATDANIESSLTQSFTADPSRMPAVLQAAISAGYVPSWGPTQASGPSSVIGPSTTTTTQTASGTQTTVTNNTYNLSYNGDTVTITNTTTKNTVHPDGSQTTETTTTQPSPNQTPEDADDQQYSLDFEESPFPEIPDFYEQKYPDGFLGAWNARKAELQSTSLFSLVTAFTSGAPAAGTCPSWSMNLNMPGVVSLGTHNLAPPCEVWPFIKAIMIITALFVARRLIFGG